MLVSFQSLTPSEQEEAFARIAEARLVRLAGEEDEVAQLVRQMRLVAERAESDDPSPHAYRAARRELVAEGLEIVEINRLIRYFGSWRLAKEALLLSRVETPRKIEARFRQRMRGKVHRYQESSLRDALMRCATDLGDGEPRPPLVDEYKLWRQREHELAKAQGRKLHLPSDSPFRRRWGTWQRALLHFGFSLEVITERLDSSMQRSIEGAKPYRFRPTRT